MKNKVKYIILDLDGTLLTESHKIMELTKQALLEVQKKGYKVILASGRPIKGMMDYAKELELDKSEGYILASNGAMIYDFKLNRVVYEERLSIEESKRILKSLEKFEIYPFVRDEDKMYVEDVYSAVIDTGMDYGVTNAYQIEARLGGFLLEELRSLKDDIDFPVLKIMASADHKYIDANVNEFDKDFKDIAYCARTAKFALEFIKNGVSKGATLERLGLNPEEILAFGDSMNDFEMLKFSKYGIAMGNAMDEVKQIAYAVTASNKEDGIYEYLKENGFLD